MPTYSYRCDCGRTSDRIAPISEYDAEHFCECGLQMRRVLTPTQISPDIEPYQVVGPEHGKWVTSRKQHREYLKKHNLLEVGNEAKYFGLK